MVRESAAPRLRFARRGAGYAAWGPGFYVWDEDPGQLLRDAGALARAVGSGDAPDAPQDPRSARASSASRRRASIAAP